MYILTIDLEDWFHIKFHKEFNDAFRWNSFESRIKHNTSQILEILDQSKTQATFFSLGWVARKYPELIRAIRDAGHEIGSHSNVHNLASSLSKTEFEEDLRKSIDSIEQVIGEKVRLYRAPAFSIGKTNTWAFESLIEQGIEVDCSVFPSFHDFGGFPEIRQNKPFLIMSNSGSLKEFPMSQSNIFGKNLVLTGGGFFRLFPYSIIKHSMKRNGYTMTYFHPRDFDENQPILEGLSYLRKFKSYYGLKGALTKFRALIEDHDFLNVSMAEEIVDWNAVNKIRFQ